MWFIERIDDLFVPVGLLERVEQLHLVRCASTEALAHAITEHQTAVLPFRSVEPLANRAIPVFDSRLLVPLPILRCVPVSAVFVQLRWPTFEWQSMLCEP